MAKDESQRTGFAQAASELRLMWRDLTDGLRATGRDTFAEGRAVLRDLDAPELDQPGAFRRLWRTVRTAPVEVQILLGVACFALWAYVVIRALGS